MAKKKYAKKNSNKPKKAKANKKSYTKPAKKRFNGKTSKQKPAKKAKATKKVVSQKSPKKAKGNIRKGAKATKARANNSKRGSGRKQSKQVKRQTIYVPSSIKVGRKIYKGKITETVAKAAKAKRMSIKNFIKKYRQEVENLATLTYDRDKKSPDQLIKLIDNSKGKKVYVDSGKGKKRKGKKRIPKAEAIKELALLQQWAKSTSNIVYLGIDRDIYLSGDIVLNMPLSDEYADFGGDDFGDYDDIRDYLEDYDIDFVISNPQEQ